MKDTQTAIRRLENARRVLSDTWTELLGIPHGAVGEDLEERYTAVRHDLAEATQELTKILSEVKDRARQEG